MSIKIKVTLGVLFLFTVILAIGGLGLYYLKSLSSDSKNILKDNYESLEYTKRIVEQCDLFKTDSARAINIMEANLQNQEENVTEKGERELTHELRMAFEEVRD